MVGGDSPDCKIVPSLCAYCGTGCGVLFLVGDGRIAGTLPMKTHPVNEGRLCIKGWNLHEHVGNSLRLKSPLIRQEGRFRKCTWDEALGHTAERLKAIVERHGPDSVAVLVSAKITNEENYLAQKFARAVIGTNNVDHCARL
jgi:predicted molibdopterin-dependent oxidoreductase YjgC